MICQPVYEKVKIANGLAGPIERRNPRALGIWGRLRRGCGARGSCSGGRYTRWIYKTELLVFGWI